MELLRQVKLIPIDDKHLPVFQLVISIENIDGESPSYSCVLIEQDDQNKGIETLLSKTDPDLDLAETAFIKAMTEKLSLGYEEEFDDVEGINNLEDYDSCGDQVEDMRQRFDILIRSNNSEKLKRLVWHIGELGLAEFSKDLEGLLISDDELLNYCLAWSLGRLKNANSFTHLEKLHKSTESELVSRISFEAMLAVSSDKQKIKLINKIKKTLPEPVQEAIDEKEHENAFALLDEHFSILLKTKGKGASELFYNLYIVASEYKNARMILIRALRKIPLSANFFKALRLLFKVAEFRFDAEIYGLLTYRLETTSSPYGKNSWEYEFIRLPGSFEYVSFEQEIEKPDCRLAYSAKSREYLRKRSWRFLKKVVKTNPSMYVDFAANFLMPYRDKDGIQERYSKVKDWRPEESGEWQQVVVDEKRYGRFSSYFAFNAILFANSKRFQLAPSRRAWLDRQDSAESDKEKFSADFTSLQRLEAYPELWDERPELLLKLLNECHCEHVQRFAAVALYNNESFCVSLSEQHLNLLLSSAYSVTAAFALEMLVQRSAKSESISMIPNLLKSTYQPARQYGISKFEENAKQLVNSEQMFAILTNVYHDVRQWGQAQLSKTPLDKKASLKLVEIIFDYLISLQDEFDAGNEKNREEEQEIINDLSLVLNKALSEYLNSVEMKRIEQLLHHPISAVQAVAGEVLIHHSISAEFLPAKVFHALIESKAENVREVGIKLFQQLPQSVLIKQAEMLASFCLSEHAQIRQTVRHVLVPLAENTPELGEKLVSLFLNQLFAKPRFENYEQTILQLVKLELSQYIYKTDTQTIWRLLYSSIRSIKQLGSQLLQKRLPSSFSVLQWTELASHSLYAVRRWAWSAFEENVDEVKMSANDSIRLLESEWQETRQFGMRYFLNHFDEKDWSPDFLISICDSERKDVQKYGCELVLDFFQEGQGLDYLVKLSQHPSLYVQEFVTNFLEPYAANNEFRIEILVPYFRSVLSHVNRGRKLKTKIYGFLQQQACKDEKLAEIIMPILNDYLFTCVATDRERIIEILSELIVLYPHIKSPLKRVNVFEAASKPKGVSNAV